MRWRRNIRQVMGDRYFWALFGWSLLVLCAFGYLFWLAIQLARDLSLVSPVLCGASESEWRVLALFLLGPFFAISVLSTIGELWNVLGLRSRGRRARLTGFIAHAVLTFLLANVILLAMNC